MSGEPPREASTARKSARTWLIISLVAWVVLIPLSAWLGAQVELGWKMLASPVNALTGAFGAVVFAAVLFKRWQDRIESERKLTERREWLRRNLLYALRCREAMSETLAMLASEAYGAIAETFGEDRVPDSDLRSDVTRRPMASSPNPELHERLAELISAITDLEAMTKTGPLATATEQVSRLFRGLVSADLDRARQTRARLFGTTEHGASLSGDPPPTSEQLSILAHAPTPEVLERLRLLADRALSLTPDMIGLHEFEPGEVRAPGIDLVMAVHRLTDSAVRPFTDHERIAGDVLRGVQDLLIAVSDLRYGLWDSARSLAQEAQAVGGRPALHTALRQLVSTASSRDEIWAIWRREHGFDTAATDGPDPTYQNLQ